MKTILLKFAGPLQSWGTSSHFESRHTDHHPSKSGVVGLLAACLGYRRDEDERIKELNGIQFGVRIDQPGHVAYDYQTVHSVKPNGKPDRTYVTKRYYLEDTIFVVAIGSEDETWIKQIENALKYPYFQPYLGRRSVPLNSDFYIKTINEDVVTSLREEKWHASEWYRKRIGYSAELPIYVDSNLLEQQRQMANRRDIIDSLSYKERRYVYRGEAKIYVHVEDTDKVGATDHDAFGTLGG